MPTVSIILPTYNRADLLPNAIDSVLAQTYSCWELLVWDDGSSDDTEAVVQSYTDERIRYFYEDNHGKSYALNRAIEGSRCAYLGFLDDDDQWLPNKLEIQLAILFQNPGINLVFGDFLNVNQQDHSEGLSFTQNARGLAQLVTQRIGEKAYLITDGWLKGIAQANFIAFDTVILRREVINTLGFFNEELKASEDFEYWWRFGLAGLSAAYTGEVIMKRFKAPGSLSGCSLESIINHFKMLDVCAKLSMAQGQSGTIAYLQAMYRNAWQNMIVACGNRGDKKKALNAFLRSLKYGFRLGSAKLLFHALIKAPNAAARGDS